MQMSLFPAVAACEPPSPLLKWPGGKSAELDVIRPLMPAAFERYFEPFVGGGAVYWTIPASTPCRINDTCVDLIRFYERVAAHCPDLEREIRGIQDAWTHVGRVTDLLAKELVAAYRGGHGVARQTVERLLSRPDAASALSQAARCAGLPVVPLTRTTVECLTDKARRTPAIEQREGRFSDADLLANFEAAAKAALYTALREAYNARLSVGTHDARRAALFLFLRENAYAAMFRFNSSGEFNVPYGGVSYNRHDLGDRIRQMGRAGLIARLGNTVIGCGDFLGFLRTHVPGPKDVLFVDPPYDTDFSDYDGNAFTETDQRRLADYLLNECGARFLAVLKDTPLIRELYAGLRVLAFDKTYAWTIKGRNDRKVRHVAILNYAPGAGGDR